MNESEIMSLYLDRGDSYFAQGMYKEALEWYSHGLMSHQKNPVLQVKKANTLVRLGRANQAYYEYLSALLDVNVLDVVDNFVGGELVELQHPREELFSLLTYKYQLPLSREGYELLLRMLTDESQEKKQRKRWNRFLQKLKRKHIGDMVKIVDFFLTEFGEQYPIYFMRFYCYLQKDIDQLLTKERLIMLLLHQQRLQELDQLERVLRSGMRNKAQLLKKMTGVEFEQYLATLFASFGYQVTKTPPVGDQGADLILKRFGEITVVQAKRWKRPVGLTAIQEVFTAKQLFHAQKAVVVTTSEFTRQAKEMAEKLGVELWNRQRLLEKIHHY